MSVRTEVPVGTYRAAEKAMLHHPHGNVGTHYGALVVHGATGDYTQMAMDPFLRALGDNIGLTSLTADYGGSTPWMNATHRDAIQSGFAYLTGRGGVRTDKVILIGGSMGFAGIMRWARENPAKVLAIIGLVGVGDSDAMYTSNRAGLAAGMDAAWGGNYMLNGSPQNPVHAGNPAMTAGIPHLLTYSNGDVSVFPSEVLALAAAIGPMAQTYAIPGDPPHGAASYLTPIGPVLGFLGGIL